MKIRTRIAIMSASSMIVVAGVMFIATAEPSVTASALRHVIIRNQDILTFDSPAFWGLLSSLFAIMNPLIAVPLFISMTENRSAVSRKRLAVISSSTVMIALAVAAIIGPELLGLFAISMPAFRIAGGIIVLLMGLAMLHERGASRSDTQAAGDDGGEGESQAVCPLAIPLLAGPGAIATIILACEAAERACDYTTIAAVIAVMAGAVYFTLRVARPIANCLGPTGLTVTTRIMGMVVSAIAIDMMINGARAVFATSM